MQHVNLTFGEMNMKGWQNLFWGRIGMMADVQPSVAISSISSATPAVVTTSADHYLASGDAIFISNGTAGDFSGQFYANVTGPTTCTLYSDPGLMSAVPGPSSAGTPTMWYCAALTKTLKNRNGDPSTDSSTLQLGQNTGTVVWRYDNRAGSQPGLHGATCQINLSALLSPGSQIYSMVLESREEIMQRIAEAEKP